MSSPSAENTPPPPTCWGKVEHCLTPPYRYVKSFFPILGKAGIFLVTLINSRVFNNLIALFVNTTQATGSSWSQYQRLKDSIQYARLLVILDMPFFVYKLAQKINKVRKGTERTDGLLELADTIAGGMDSTAMFIRGLYMAGKAGERAVQVATGLTGASCALSVAAIFQQARRHAQGSALLTTLSGKGDGEALQHLSTLTETQLENAFDAEMDAKLIKAEFSKTDRADATNVRTAVVKRLSEKQWVHKLNIVAAVIAIIATAILLNDGNASVANGFVAGSALISVGVFFYDRRSKARFRKALIPPPPPPAPPTSIT